MAMVYGRQFEYASLQARVVGTIIDGVIAGALYISGILLLRQLTLSNWFTIYFLLFLVYIFYFTWPISKFAQTPGFKLMKIRVIKTDGTNLGFMAAFLRYVLKTVLGIISILFYGLNPQRQMLHDMVVDSIVVNETNS